MSPPVRLISALFNLVQDIFYTRGGGGAASRAATVFRALDVNDRMALEFDTMMSGLAQFGMCAGLDYSQVCKSAPSSAAF